MWTLPKEVEHILTLLEIREQNGYDVPQNANLFSIMLRKSALYSRLMEGKDPLPIPPPLSYSYPWYDLIDKGEGTSSEVWEPTGLAASLTSYPTIIIDQFTWKVLEKLGPDEWVITYPYGKNREHFADESWHLQPSGILIAGRGPLWKLKRID